MKTLGNTIRAAWVFPTPYFYPVKAHELYDQYHEQYVLADEVGFDGIMTNEHHASYWCMKPAVNLDAAVISERRGEAHVSGFRPTPERRKHATSVECSILNKKLDAVVLEKCTDLLDAPSAALTMELTMYSERTSGGQNDYRVW